MLNDPQLFEEHITDLPFFVNPAFQFGCVATDVNWFEAAGVPIAASDDFGRENPYPLMKVEAHVGGNAVATLDTVMPISGEAECQICHQPTDASLPLGNNGPHGMHAISGLQFSSPDFLPDDRWNQRHRNYRDQGPSCESCQGADVRGTVLSRTAEDRTVRCKDRRGSLPGCAAGNPTAIIPKGAPVGCGLCHRQK